VSVVACCVTAALAYSGAVTLLAMLAYLLPAVVVTAAVTFRTAGASVRAAAFVGLGLSLALAEVVNLVSGTGNGPAARSTFTAAAFTALAVALVTSRRPALFLVGVAGVVVGALALGAGAEVAPVAVGTAVVSVVALGVVESSSRRWTERSRGLVVLLVAALLVGVAVAVVALQADRERGEAAPAVLAPGAVAATIRPPQALGDPDPLSATPTPTPTRESPSPVPESAAPDVSVVWTWLGLLLLALVVLVVGRLGCVWLRWRLLRRRLRRGAPADRVAGAWQWSVRRLRAAGWPVPASLSADRAASAAEVGGLPRIVRPAFRRVAVATVDVVYAPPGNATDDDEVWRDADEVGQAAVATLSPARRLAFAVRSISSALSPSAASAPGSTEEQHL
jgi:hypothetical protein